MAITNTVVNSRTQIPAIGGGSLVLARVTCNLSAAASHAVTPWLTALGLDASSGSVISIYDGGATADVEDGAGVGISPYIDYSGQTLEYRKVTDGAVGATNVAFALGVATISFNIVVRA